MELSGPQWVSQYGRQEREPGVGQTRILGPCDHVTLSLETSVNLLFSQRYSCFLNDKTGVKTAPWGMRVK